MDIATDNSKSVINLNHPGPILAMLRAIQGAVWWLAGLVILTDEDRTNAGIYMGEDGRD